MAPLRSGENRVAPREAAFGLAASLTLGSCSSGDDVAVALWLQTVIAGFARRPRVRIAPLYALGPAQPNFGTVSRLL
jgi:hypothetical protein